MGWDGTCAQEEEARTKIKAQMPGLLSRERLVQRLPEERRQGEQRWGPTEYFHALYPESAFPETTPEVASWPGSDDMHFFTGKYNKTSDDELIRRKKLCVCDPCFEGARTRARGCDTSDLFSPPSFSSTRFVTGKYWNCRSNAKDRCLWYGPRGKLLLAAVLASPCCVFPQCVSPHVCRAKALS